MPFRHNFFGEPIAQPETERGEIDDILVNKHGEAPAVMGATIDDDGGDEEFGWGGAIQFGDLEDEPETQVEELKFDGFETLDAARTWLTDYLDISEDDIELISA